MNPQAQSCILYEWKRVYHTRKTDDYSVEGHIRTTKGNSATTFYETTFSACRYFKKNKSKRVVKITHRRLSKE